MILNVSLGFVRLVSCLLFLLDLTSLVVVLSSIVLLCPLLSRGLMMMAVSCSVSLFFLVKRFVLCLCMPLIVTLRGTCFLMR